MALPLHSPPNITKGAANAGPPGRVARRLEAESSTNQFVDILHLEDDATSKSHKPRRRKKKTRGEMLTKLFHNLDYKSGYAKGYTRGFEESIGYKKGYAAGEKLAREQAANMNAATQK